jgi:pimeloyl-ACP methyl ester carboxylesterase
MRWVLGVFVTLVLLLIGAGIGGWLWLRSPDLPQAELEARYGSSASRFAELPGGVRLHYKDEGAGPVLLLVHGFGDNLWTWDGWTKELTSRYRIIRVDLPGHGLTGAPTGTRIDVAADADLIAALAKKLALPKFVVAGNSLGGAVAWQVAVRHPDILKGLILVDAAGLPSDKPAQKPPFVFQLLQYQWARAILKTIDSKPLIVSSLKGEVGNPAVITPQIVDRWAELQRAPGHRDILLGAPLTGKSLSATAEIHKIALPTLILWGEIDPVLDLSVGKKFAAAIPGAHLVVYPHVGHLPQIEIPQASAKDVETFLGGLH